MLFKRSKDDHPIVTRTLNNICNDAKVSHTPSVNVTSLRHRGTVQGRGWNSLTGDKNIYYTSYKGRKCFIMPLIDFNVSFEADKLWFTHVYCDYKHACT